RRWAGLRTECDRRRGRRRRELVRRQRLGVRRAAGRVDHPNDQHRHRDPEHRPKLQPDYYWRGGDPGGAVRSIEQLAGQTASCGARGQSIESISIMKLIWLALVPALTLSIDVSAQKKSYTIGLVAKSQGNPVFQAARVGANDAAKELGGKYGIEINIDWRTPNEEDAQKQAAAIEQLVLSGANGIAVSCSDANKLTDAINSAVKNGVPVATF